MVEHKTKIASVSGPTHTGSGDIIINNLELAYHELRDALPEDHPAIQGLVKSLKSFAAYHEPIKEWKDLHNLLQELYNAIGPFYNKIDQLQNSTTEDEKIVLNDLRGWWRPCQRRIRSMIRFAKKINYIWSEPYYEENGTLRGPDWVVEIVTLRQDIEVLLWGDVYDIRELYKLTAEFSDACLDHLYEADKNLRNEADNLYRLSSYILAKLE